jgi:hypothetical protein
MFDKFTLKHWLILFVVLLALVVLYKVVPSQKGRSSFKTDIVQIDAAKVTQIAYYKGSDAQKTIELNKENNQWTIKNATLTTSGDKSTILNLLTQIEAIKPLRLAAKSEDQWAKYDVTDSAGTHLTIKEGNKTVLNIIVGRFTAEKSSNPYSQQPDIYTYVRLVNEKEVYVIEGFLSMAFSEDISMFRNKSVTNLKPNDITSVELNAGENSFRATKQGNDWKINNLAIDSTKMAHYLMNIANVRSSSFAQQNDIKSNDAAWKLKIEGNNFKAIELSAFPADSTMQTVIRSSENPDNLFNGNAYGLNNKFYIIKDSLLVH